MITLYCFGANFGLAEPSPFVLKVDAYMRMSGIDFVSIPDVNNLTKAPKGKLPFISDNGEVIGDSYFIIEHLRQSQGDRLDHWLTDEQKAATHLLTKSLDEHFYWCIVHSRWINDDTWPIVKHGFFDGMPFPIKYIVPVFARKAVRKNMLAHGMGKHGDEEILHIAEHSLQSLSALLGDKAFFFGEQPSSFDASAYAFLAQVILVSIDNALNKKARTFGNLVAYCERIKEQYYAD